VWCLGVIATVAARSSSPQPLLPPLGRALRRFNACPGLGMPVPPLQHSPAQPRRLPAVAVQPLHRRKLSPAALQRREGPQRHPVLL
jgi:hypothetical protein